MPVRPLDDPIDRHGINPGSRASAARSRQVTRKAKDRGLPMRIGVNAGSLEREVNEKYGFPCPPAMVESALRYIEVAESEGYRDIIVSLKSSDVLVAVGGYRPLAPMCGYPPPHGLTAAG